MRPRVQAMPGVEQARPSGRRAQITQPSVHSAQAGSGVAPEVSSGPNKPAPAMAARSATARATITARLAASDSWDEGMGLSEHDQAGEARRADENAPIGEGREAVA